MTINPKNRIDELDALRGIAAIMVVLYHYTFRFEELFQTTVVTDHFNFQYGFHGVELFFILSGFVIFMSIERINNPTKFIYKRFIRLYPTFWICMIFSFIFITWFGPNILKVSFTEFLVNFSMLPSFFNTDAVDGVYWTLKVEMFFYIVVFIVLLLKKKEKYKIIGYCYILLGIISFIVLRPTYYYYYGTLFLLGIHFYKIWKGFFNWENYLQIFLLLIFSWFYDHLEIFIVTALLVGTFLLMVHGKLKFLKIPILLFFGKISYALYLVHQYFGYTIELWLIENGIDNFVLILLIPLITSILVAVIITFYIEKHIMSFFGSFKQSTDKSLNKL